MSEEMETAEENWEEYNEPEAEERAQGGETLILLGLVAVCDPDLNADTVVFEQFDENNTFIASLRVPITEENADAGSISISFIRSERANFIGLHGADPTHLRVHPDDWDDIEDIVNHLNRPRPEETINNADIPRWARLAADMPHYGGAQVRVTNPDPAPRGQIEQFRRDADLHRENWLYPEGIASMAGNGNCRSTLTMESMLNFGAASPSAYVTLRIPEMHILVTTRNAPIPAINWRNEREVQAFLRAMRRRVFKHATAWLRAEFERHKRNNPEARTENPPF